MISSGANIIDVGGESTRPGSKTINSKIEWKRLETVIKSFKKKYKNVCLSLDTRKTNIMTKGIKYGVDLINDVSGFKFDKDTISNLAKHNIPKVLHHMQGTPNTMQLNPIYNNVLLDIYDFFELNITKNFKDRKIILDPGIGFGKTVDHNFELLSRLNEFNVLELPIMIGPSRKSFIGITLDLPPEDRVEGTAAAVSAGVMNGASIVRVHDVKSMKRVVRIIEKVRNV